MAWRCLWKPRGPLPRTGSRRWHAGPAERCGRGGAPARRGAGAGGGGGRAHRGGRGGGPPPVVGGVLGAGQGGRMGGQAKAALSFDGISILESLVHALGDGGCAQVNVLVGTHADVLRPLAERSGAQVTAVSHAL